MIHKVQQDPSSSSSFSWDDTLITSKAWHHSGGKWCYDATLYLTIISWRHTGGGHSGVTATIERLLQFCTEKDRRNSNSFREFIKSCVICQQYKSENMTSPGSLCPLPLPTAIFTDFTIDFIEGFLKSSGKDVILICLVDRMTKYVHFMAFGLVSTFFYSDSGSHFYGYCF